MRCHVCPYLATVPCVLIVLASRIAVSAASTTGALATTSASGSVCSKDLEGSLPGVGNGQYNTGLVTFDSQSATVETRQFISSRPFQSGLLFTCRAKQMVGENRKLSICQRAVTDSLHCYPSTKVVSNGCNYLEATLPIERHHLNTEMCCVAGTLLGLAVKVCIVVRDENTVVYSTPAPTLGASKPSWQTSPSSSPPSSSPPAPASSSSSPSSSSVQASTTLPTSSLIGSTATAPSSISSTAATSALKGTTATDPAAGGNTTEQKTPWVSDNIVTLVLISLLAVCIAVIIALLYKQHKLCAIRDIPR
ncbi:uncharacterized protein LOC135821070 isoform X2 [Sycon ciliatum]|uniref:uncharacterized protein LOC135821070 isoform X2 n=1 Tax=Sycon ciliatum TaxID=27933 RepID=UPI0031F70A24